MKTLKKILSLTLTYKFIDMLYCLYIYIRDYNYIKDTLYSENLHIVLKKYLKVDFKKDWIGRLYGIINPNIDINGNFDINTVILEFDDENTNSTDYVKTWIHKQLMLIRNLFKIDNLYDYINLNITHVGPKMLDNYLLVFDIIARKQFTSSLKKFLLQLLIYLIIFVFIYFIIF